MGSSAPASRLLSRALGALLPVGLAAALVVVPGHPEGEPPVAPELRPVAAALPSAPYRTFTLNIKHDLGPKKALADMRKALTLGVVGGFQEMSDVEDRETLIELTDEMDWGWYMPREGGVAIPIVWDRERFRLIDSHTVQTHGPEQDVTPGRYINVVRLREIATGKVFGFINTHTIAQASFDAQATDMHRIPRLRKHLQMLRQEILDLSASTEHVFAAGDLNVNYLADRRRQVAGLPTDALGDLVNFDMPLEGSRGPTSLLDYGMTLKANSGLRRTDSTVVRGFNSDHDAVVLTYQPVDLLADGPLFNRPDGTLTEQNRVVDRMSRAVMNAEDGGLVRVASNRLDDPTLARALLAAHAEGVQVRIVLGGGSATDVEQELAATLGDDVSASSWLLRCESSCLGGDGVQEANFLLVSRAGGTTELTMVPSGPALLDGGDRWSDVLITSTPDVYAGYGELFDRMSVGTAGAPTGATMEMGEFRAQLYPVPAESPRDPVLSALRAVGCKNARGIRTDDGRTNVRIAVQAWSGDRGRLIAERLAVLRSRGCDVVAVVGPKVRKGIRRILDRSDVVLRGVATGQNLLVVDGRYGDKAGAQYAWTGGPGWTDRALGSDGVTLVVPHATMVNDYLDGFSRVWTNG